MRKGSFPRSEVEGTSTRARRTTAPMPRWVKICIVSILVLVLVFVILHLTGHGMGNMHMHMSFIEDGGRAV